MSSSIVISGLTASLVVGLLAWNIVLTTQISSNTNAINSITSTFLAPQIIGMGFDVNHNVVVNISGSISSDPNVYQYIAIMRGLAIFLSDETSDPLNLPIYSISRTNVTFTNLTLLGGDVIIHRFYSTPSVMNGTSLVSVTKTYHRLCVNEIRNLTIPYCWDMTTQNYCTTPQIGITGQILTNVTAYVKANVSAELELDERSGCFYVVLNSALDRTLFRSMHSDIKATQAGQGNCMKFLMRPVSTDGIFLLPAFEGDEPLYVTYTSGVVAEATLFINFEGNADELVIISSSADSPPYVHTFNTPVPVTINVTICGYLSSWSFHSFPIPSGFSSQSYYPYELNTGIVDVYQWGDLGLRHFDFNYYANDVAFVDSSFTTVSATDQPSPHTLTSITNLQYNYNNNQTFGNNRSPVTNFAEKIGLWNMTNVKKFDYMFSNSMITTSNISGISNWRLSNTTASTFNGMFLSFTAAYTNISIADWNPLVGSIDYAFALQSVIIPDITTWALMPNVCGNQMLLDCFTLTTPLYDELLIKFANETVSVNCVWQGTKRNSTSVSDAAVATLCGRGWNINDVRGNRCCGLVPC